MELICDKSEAMRYLGYRGQDISESVSALIDATAHEAEEAVTPRYCTVESEISRTKDGIYVEESGMLLCGDSIFAHLEECTKILMLAATIGIEIDQKIRIYENQDLTRAVILDCCGSAMIETYCDKICAGLDERMKESGYYLTTRFSPGYGDLPLSLQADFLRATNAQRRIGLTCNDQFLMFPRKSVTAIIGLSKKQPKACIGVKCDTCSMNKTCTMRRR